MNYRYSVLRDRYMNNWLLLVYVPFVKARRQTIWMFQARAHVLQSRCTFHTKANFFFKILCNECIEIFLSRKKLESSFHGNSWVIEGVLLIEYMPKDTTINAICPNRMCFSFTIQNWESSANFSDPPYSPYMAPHN